MSQPAKLRHRGIRAGSDVENPEEASAALGSRSELRLPRGADPAAKRRGTPRAAPEAAGAVRRLPAAHLRPGFGGRGALTARVSKASRS